MGTTSLTDFSYHFHLDILLNIYFQRRIRAVLVEKNVSSWGRAETAIKLIDRDFSVDDSIEAAIYGGDVTQALRYLRQDCSICLEQKPMSQVGAEGVD